jgi:hypothetical protein
MGYYIGSGPIESGNKSVVQQRCKQAGMMWDKKNAQYMLALSVKTESGLGFKGSTFDTISRRRLNYTEKIIAPR